MLDTEAIYSQDARRIEESFAMKFIDFSNSVFLGDGPDTEIISSLENLKSMLRAMLQKQSLTDPSFETCRPDLSVQDAEQRLAMNSYARTKTYGYGSPPSPSPIRRRMGS
eukprot:symbB.v1.2.016754.t1/scaffold1279.1/size127165/3